MFSIIDLKRVPAWMFLALRVKCYHLSTIMGAPIGQSKVVNCLRNTGNC